MQIFLVGGAVRDKLLNYPVKDEDFLVVGTTPDQMLAAGYQQVGKSFPVFLHPKTHNEYALARTELKQGAGYTGFVCDFSPDISIEQDLRRRDLTINAMAMSDDGEIIDPYGGQKDLANKTLRHVSEAFTEDPLRVLRVARFAARYAHLGFTVASETMDLLGQISDSGELKALTAERVWLETQSALNERSPQVYFKTLKDCGALKEVFPELDQLWGVPNPEKWHPEIDTGVHTMMVLEQACSLSKDLQVRFAALTHDLGKGLTPAEHWPHHHGHEKTGLALVQQLCERLKVPNDYRQLALLVCEYHTHCHRALELNPKTLVKLFDGLDAWRKPERFEQFLQCCTADLRGRTGFEQAPYKQTRYLEEVLKCAKEVAIKPIVDAGFKGAAIRQELTRQRVEVIELAKKRWLAESGQ